MDVTLRLNDLVEEFDGDARKALLAALAKIDMLQSRLAHLREANAWHPASEPPDFGETVLVMCEKGVIGKAEIIPYPDADNYIWIGVDERVIYWRELPAPPDITSDMP